MNWNKTDRMKTECRQLLNGAAALTVLVALAVLGGPAAAFAQDAAQSQDTIQSSTVSPSLEGSWLYTVRIPILGSTPIIFLGTETYSAGGGYVEADQLSFTPGYLATAGHGTWKAIGNNQFLLTYINLTYDNKGNPTGHGKVRQIATIDGTNYQGSGDFFYFDLNGKLVASGTFTIGAKKVPVEAPKR
jgi:hypothetical protein